MTTAPDTQMISPTFPQLGWQILPGPETPVRVQVFGERSSGTNFLKRLIGRNTALAPTEELGWKHGFAQMTAVPRDVLLVVVVRDARAWALSMFARPWHTPPDMQRLEFHDFIRAEWATIADRPRYFPQVAASGGVGQPLQLDRHPVTGAPFDNLFALRGAKLAGHVGLMNRARPVALVRLETVQADPEGFVAALSRTLELPQVGAYRPVLRRLGTRFQPAVAPRPDPPRTLAPDDLAFLRGQIDPDLEARLGYAY